MKKYDLVMPYTKLGVDSRANTCGEHFEIEYVIASVKKFCSPWAGRIFIVGSEPPEVIKDDVIHIPCDDPYKHCKDANIIHKLRYACENIPDLTDDFLMISDDQIVTRECTWGDFIPRIVRMYTDWSEDRWRRNRNTSFWRESLYQTLRLFPKESSAMWEPHIWSPMNKYLFVDMCKKYDYKHNISCISQSLYYNFIHQPIVRNFEHIYVGNKKISKVFELIDSLDMDNLPLHLSWADDAFEQSKFRKILGDITGLK